MKPTLRCLVQNKPNLIFRKSKITGRPLEQLLQAKVPVPRFKGEALFGIYPVLESLEMRKRIPSQLYIKDSVRKNAEEDGRISRILEISKEIKLPVRRITQVQLDHITDFQLHNGICLDTTALPFTRLSLCKFSVYLDGVLDTGNIGAIARSCLFFGVQQLIYSDNRGPSSIAPSMSKASCGAIERLPVVRLKCLEELFTTFPDAYFIGTSDYSTSSRYGARFAEIESLPILEDKSVILVLGAEDSGISPKLGPRCDIFTTIDGGSNSAGHVNSLNVSVVAGILLQKLYRKVNL